MEDKKAIKVSFGTVICIFIIMILLIALVLLFFKVQELSENQVIVETANTSNSTNSLKEENIIEVTKNNNVNGNNVSNNISVDKNEITNTNNYEINTIKNIYDVISDNDTEIEKAQKIAKEVMNAVNNKDWYYLAKIVGTDADYFVKYGIYNYNVDINDYQEIDGEYIFSEVYDWDKTKLNSPKDISLGNMLIIKFEDGGKIVIDTNCTGI